MVDICSTCRIRDVCTKWCGIHISEHSREYEHLFFDPQRDVKMPDSIIGIG